MNKKFLSLFAGLLLSAGLSMASAQAAENPFGMSDATTVQNVSMSTGKCGDGKCGDGKGKGEAKCGGSSDSTKKDGKCGAGKCGDGK